MEKTKDFILPDSFVMPHYTIIATLIAVLDHSKLADPVKKHCKTGLKGVCIIHADEAYNTGKSLLLKKDFDHFFTFFPDIYFNNRALIPAGVIIKNVERCIKANKILSVDS